MKEAMGGLGEGVSHAGHGATDVGARAQVSMLAQNAPWCGVWGPWGEFRDRDPTFREALAETSRSF